MSVVVVQYSTNTLF